MLCVKWRAAAEGAKKIKKKRVRRREGAEQSVGGRNPETSD